MTDIDLTRAAVVIIDMHNDALHEQGWGSAIGGDTSIGRALVEPTNASLSDFRRAGAHILWVNWAVRPDGAGLPLPLVEAYRQAGAGIGLGDRVPGRGHQAMTAGSWGSEVYDRLLVGPSDLVVAKSRVSAFFETGLDAILRRCGIESLLFAGMNLDQCVAASLADASNLGYRCYLLTDLCGTTSPQFCVDATLYNVAICYGTVTTSGAVLSQATQ